jgi:hypothetical protein
MLAIPSGSPAVQASDTRLLSRWKLYSVVVIRTRPRDSASRRWIASQESRP